MKDLHRSATLLHEIFILYKRRCFTRDIPTIHKYMDHGTMSKIVLLEQENKSRIVSEYHVLQEFEMPADITEQEREMILSQGTGIEPLIIYTSGQGKTPSSEGWLYDLFKCRFSGVSWERFKS